MRSQTQKAHVAFGREIYPALPSTRLKRTPYRRCQHCRTWNDTRRTSWSDTGEGLVKTAEPGAGDSITRKYSSPALFVAKSGCRFCGSLNWTPAKPRKIEDLSKNPRKMKATSQRRWR